MMGSISKTVRNAALPLGVATTVLLIGFTGACGGERADSGDGRTAGSRPAEFSTPVVAEAGALERPVVGNAPLESDYITRAQRSAPERLGHGASIIPPEWWHWATLTDCVAELQLMDTYDLRYNTESGLPPEGAPDHDRRWQSFIPLRFEVRNVLWCSDSFDGVIMDQLRQRIKVPDGEIVAGFHFPWWVREESLDSQPHGLASILFTDGIRVEPERSDYYQWRYLLDVAETLSTGGDTYRYTFAHLWYEYDGANAISVSPEVRVLPIADLLDEVHEALQLAGKE